MRLGELLNGVNATEKINWRPGYKIGKITSDSRMLIPGDLFVACRGARMDGHDFLSQAIQAKPAGVVYEDLADINLPPSITGIRVKDSLETLSILLKNYYEAPDQKIRLIGVTGTNGKTTIAYLLHLLLRENAPAAYLGTLWYELPGQKLPAVNTTPGPEILIPLLADMAREKVKHCVMEVSSHALSQKRVHGLRFEVGIFTQLTQDHLDYHKNMEDYFKAKKIFFDREPRPRHILVNIDCPYGQRIYQDHPEAKTISFTKPADYQIKNVEPSFQGSRFLFCFKGRQSPFQIRLPLLHNVSNVAQVLAALDLLGYDPEDFKGSLQEIPGIPGRMERVSGSDQFQVFVDYAHTPDAMENVLHESLKLHPRRILTLFGCGGDRDKSKRPLMGEIACKYSDLVVLTSDNPRSENPEKILKDVLKGMKSRDSKVETHVVIDRKEGIEKIISLAESGDVVLILGKGHEDYQILGDVKIPFDDRQVVQECLKRKSRVFLS